MECIYTLPAPGSLGFQVYEGYTVLKWKTEYCEENTEVSSDGRTWAWHTLSEQDVQELMGLLQTWLAWVNTHNYVLLAQRAYEGFMAADGLHDIEYDALSSRTKSAWMQSVQAVVAAMATATPQKDK